MEPLHIIGGGSIGLLFAASIRGAFPAYPLSLLLRDHHKSNIDDDEIMVCLMKDGRPRMMPVPAQLISEERPRPIRNLLVTTKAHSAVSAVESVLERLDPKSASIIVLCNGAFSVRDELTELISSSRSIKAQQNNNNNNTELILATTTHGAYQEPNNQGEMYHVVHAGVGSTFIEDQPSISQLWDQSGLVSKSISSEAMMGMLWQKLATNCAINPISALLGCENGQLLQSNNDDNLPSIEEIIREVSLVATKSCQESESLQSTLTYDSLRNFVDQVIQDTSHNRSSMLQDVTKKQKTEIHYLNGYVARLGNQFGIETPANNEVCRRITELEIGFDKK